MHAHSSLSRATGACRHELALQPHHNTWQASLMVSTAVGASSSVRLRRPAWGPCHQAASLLRRGSSGSFCMQVVRDLHAEGHRVVIVSSGAVGVGAQRMGLAARPKDIAQKQALAAVGQVHLMRFYEDFFHALGLVRGVTPPRRCHPPASGSAHRSHDQARVQEPGMLMMVW